MFFCVIAPPAALLEKRHVVLERLGLVVTFVTALFFKKNIRLFTYKLNKKNYNKNIVN